jgi:hypothetical protein
MIFARKIGGDARISVKALFDRINGQCRVRLSVSQAIPMIWGTEQTILMPFTGRLNQRPQRD